jgi:hypothetical protein
MGIITPVIITVLPGTADSVEKVTVWMKVIASTSYLARCDLALVPSSVQMMGFVG